METVSFSIPPPEALDKMNDEQLDARCKEIAAYLFTYRPDPERIRNDLASFFRYLAEKRSPATVYAFVTEHMKPFTTPDSSEFSEDNEQYLTELSKALHNHGDYQHTFTLIAEAVRKGEIEVLRPEPTTPTD